jgi:phosphoglycerol transferase MdoB-like AlkP superfamily enzyme
MEKLKLPRYLYWIALTGAFFLLLMSFLRWLLVAIFSSAATKQVSLSGAYILGLRFDLRVVCILMLLLFLVGSIPNLHPLNKKWGRRVALWLMVLFISTLCLFYAFDLAHYAYLHQRLNASVLNYADDAKISFKMMWQTYHLGWSMLGLIAAIVLLLGIVKLIYNHALSRGIVSTKKSRVIWSIAFVLLMALGIVGRPVFRGGQYPLRWSDAFSKGNDYVANISLNPFQSFFSSMGFRKSGFDEKKVRQHYTWMSQFLGVDKPDAETLNFERVVIGDPTKPKPNVVLVICESFSMYKSSMAGNPLNTTPFFNEMCNKGIFFDRCFTPAYGTARGVWATLTGIPDIEMQNTSSRNPAAVDQHIIINDFSGYEKYYFLGGSSSWANIRGLLTNNIQGLHLYEEGSYQSKVQDVWGISDKQLFLEANAVLGKEQKPFFAVIQTADNHRPYTIPKEDLNEFHRKSPSKDSLRNYGFENEDEYNAFRYTDFSYQKFIEAAQKEKYFSNTIFVFVGDHGIPGDASKMLPAIYNTAGLVSTHVPLLFYAPNLLQPIKNSNVVSQVDVLPSIAGLCNISYSNKTMGRDIVKAVKDAEKHYVFNTFADIRKVATIGNDYVYGYYFNNPNQQEFAPFNTSSPLNDDIKKQYRFITDAFYETARYMILNNKKKTP